jgi:hypothetical protein
MGRRKGTKIVRRKIIDVVIVRGKSKSYNIYLFKLECGHVEQRGYSPSVDITAFSVLQKVPDVSVSCSSCAYGKDNQGQQEFFEKVRQRELEASGKQKKIQYIHKGCGGVIFHHGVRPLDKPIKRKYQDVCGNCGRRWDYGDEQEPDVEVREVLV